MSPECSENNTIISIHSVKIHTFSKITWYNIYNSHLGVTALEFISALLSGGKLITIAAIVIVVLFILLIKAPLKFIFKVFFNTLAGFIFLWIINYFGNYIGLTIPITWLTAVIVGVLGLPGAALLIVFRFLGII